MLVWENLTKEFTNSMRIFKKSIKTSDFRLLKNLITSIIKHKTLVISHLFDTEKTTSSKKKFVEKISNMLWRLTDITDIIKKQSIKLVKKYSDNDIKIISYDGTDIAKPKSKKLPLLSWIFDPSIKSFYRWYLVVWVFVNEFLYSFELLKPKYDKEEEKYKADYSKLNWEKIFFETIKKFWEENTIHIWDRFYDDKNFIYTIHTHTKNYLIRWKTNRKVILKESWEKILVWELKEWKYRIIIDKVETNLYVVNSKKEWKLLIYSGIQKSLKEIKELYLKRWDIEKAFKDTKEFWLEKVRLRDFEKIRKILAIIQFIYNTTKKLYIRIKKAESWFWEFILKIFKKYIKIHNLSNNFHAFLTFLSQKIYVSELYNLGLVMGKTLFPIWEYVS